MNDAEKFELAKDGLKFCPECGGPLTKHLYLHMVGCVDHGDFMLLWIEGDLHVRWRALRMAPAYQAEKNSPDLHAIFSIGDMYVKGEVSFIEACKLIAVAYGKEFPNDPSSEDLMMGHSVLDDFMQTAPPVGRL